MRLYRGILLFSVALSTFPASAARVSIADVESAVRAFAANARHLVREIGSFPHEVREHAASGGLRFYSARMVGGGTVFLSGDDDFEPVIAFTSSDVDYDHLDQGSPLRALLDGDPRARRISVSAREKWRRLMSVGDSIPVYPSLLSVVRLSAGISEPVDIRVPALVETQWNQSAAGDKMCFNLYTPGNSVCGCVATAMSQVMRYHRWPDAYHPVSADAFVCGYNSVATNLTMQGGVYDWSLMPAGTTEDPIVTEEQRREIGRLTSDAGISVEMAYTKDDSGAYGMMAVDSLMDVWHYGQATLLDDYAEDGCGYIDGVRGDTNRREVLQKVLFSNFDNGCPVMLGISGNGGHCIVADGYGFENDVDYVHLNMGWSGSYDLWYNLPSIGSGYRFSSVQEAVYNVFPTNGLESAALSGRVLNVDSNGVSSAKVTIRRAGTSEIVAEIESSPSGVYGAILPGATEYDITAVSSDLSMTGEVFKVALASPEVYDYEDESGLHCSRMVFSYEEVGNRWGVDIVLGIDARARTTPTNFYVSASSGVDAPDRGTFAAPYATIQYAITNGQPLASGDVIHVLPGTYYGCVESPSTSVSIVSTDGPEVTLIDGEGRDCCYYGEANPDNLLSGFTITNGAYYGGICIGTATNCVIVGCASGSDVRYGYGGGASSASLYGCVIHNNEADYGGGAAGCVLVNCTVYDNWAYFAGGGVDCDCAVTNSIVWRNWADVDDLVENWERNESLGSWGSVVKCPSFTCSCTFPDGFEDLGGNITNDPMCVSFDVDDWRLRIGSPCAGAGLWGLNMGAWQGDPLPGYVISAEVNGRGSVLPRSRFVLEGEDAVFTASGDHPFLGMETNGVLASVERLFVWRNVRADGLLTACFGVTNYCVDAAVGDDGNDGLSWAAPLKTIFGMVQKAGRGDRAAFRPGVYDGCEWCVYGVEAESTDGPSVTIIDGGGTNRCVYADEMVYRGFTFRNGNAWVDYGGGALYGAFVDCVFSNCTAAYGGAAAGSVMTNCLVVGNRAESYQSNGRNIGGYGGGVYESVLVNCTVADNTAYRYGGGAYLHSQGEARNSIICGNMSESGSSYGNDVYGNHYWTMSNSLSDVDAKFRDAANGDYRILPSSLAVDAGSIDFVSVNCDLAGTNRTWGAAVDIGCYEYHLPPCVTDPTDIGVAAALAAEGYCGEYSAAVTEPKDYAYLIEWARDHGLAASDLNTSPTGFISPALNADGLLDLDPTNLVVKSFVPLSGNGWNLLLTMPGYEIAKVNIPLLKAAIGLIGSGTLDGVYSADGLDITVTPAMDDVEIKIAIPEASPDYFLKVTIR